MVVDDSIGVTKVLFVSPVIGLPPVDTVYQRYCPAAAPEALRVTLAIIQDVLPVTEGAAGKVLMVATTGVRLLSHIPLLTAT